jgi:hypothetical protein
LEYNKLVRVHHSARKHRVEEEDILHAIENALAEVDLDDERTLLLGPDRSARMLEIVVLQSSDVDELIVIHAMPMRRQFQRFLPEQPGQT